MKMLVKWHPAEQASARFSRVLVDRNVDRGGLKPRDGAARVALCWPADLRASAASRSSDFVAAFDVGLDDATPTACAAGADLIARSAQLAIDDGDSFRR